jgi:lysophospholipase L1-like esterase
VPTPPTTPAPIPAPPAAPPPTTFSAELNASSIFIGASIINRWPLPIHNAGISGQNTSEILQRFPGTVIGRGYTRVIMQGGTNDILQGVRDPPSTISANFASMGQMARAANIDVVLISLGPISTNGVNYDSTVVAVNARLRQLALDQGYVYIDIFTPMQGHPEYLPDGFHPNALGYSVIEKALSQLVTK